MILACCSLFIFFLGFGSAALVFLDHAALHVISAMLCVLIGMLTTVLYYRLTRS